MAKKSPYKRILLKLSGEALMGAGKFGIEHKASKSIAAAVNEIHLMGIQIGIVVGGGNIFRGSHAKEFGFSRTPADHIGMLATMINGLVLQQSLAALGCESHVMSAFDTDSIIEKYHWQGALAHLERGALVIFVGGTGNPYFTTDTAAALRASEINANVLIKATKVDGVYDKDPIRYPSAKKFDQMTYSDILNKKLNVMDSTAIALCRENKIPVHVINLFKKGALLSAVTERKGGSLVTGD
ncbi:MAG: UMP kinase [Verrucomicrobia bacterium]|nr:UMP kinase [Verrucomicrobiota bacterium]